MRHAREIGDHGLAADGLAQAERKLVPGALEVRRREQLAQMHRLALDIGQLNADGVAVRHHGDATQAETALMDPAMSSTRLITREDLVPGAGSSS